MLELEFMQRALLAAVLVGLVAPAVGTFLVQRRLALVGDGMGHVALAGVAAGVLTSTSPVWAALIAAVLGAIVIELLRVRGRAGGDVALAVLFYGGIAGGVVLISVSASGTSATLTSYLFGSITTTTRADLIAFAGLSLTIVVTLLLVGTHLFAVSDDEEYARATGMNVLAYNLVLAVLTAVTVVVSMRVIGLLLISALMIIPNAAAQQLARGFRATLGLAMGIGVAAAIGGVTVSYQLNTPSGGTIVLLTIGVFLLAVIVQLVRSRVRVRAESGDRFHPHTHGPGCGHEAIEHDGHIDYVHDGVRHAPHGGHYDQH